MRYIPWFYYVFYVYKKYASKVKFYFSNSNFNQLLFLKSLTLTLTLTTALAMTLPPMSDPNTSLTPILILTLITEHTV